MFVKSKIWFSAVLMLCMTVFGVNACGVFNSEFAPASTTPVPYMPTVLPGSIVEADASTIQVRPQPSDSYLQNPGIGWQNGASSNSFGLPESVAYSNRRDIAWSVLNPAEGVYDWSALEKQFRKATAAGRQFSFRVYTMVGEGFGGPMVPNWVLENGAAILPSGEPDYSNCVYQDAWGNFVNELIKRYDGNRDIAFIDISGYGNFNEWSWQDEQTEWDEQWQDDHANGNPSAGSFKTIDGQARRRLADMFIGGSFQRHSCRMPNGNVVQVDYSYEGFQKTQLVMPYAGIIQSTQYVLSRRPDVGFRYDCLGREADQVYQNVRNEIDQIWPQAPIAFELCKPDEVDIENAASLLTSTHGSVVHDNNWNYSSEQLEDLLLNVGYRYFLKQARVGVQGQHLIVQMDWQNLGSAPNYPKMGQDFSLHFYIVNKTGNPVLDHAISADIFTWRPFDVSNGESTTYSIFETIPLPSFFRHGDYFAGVSILDLRTGLPIQLAFGSPDKNGIYILFPVTIK